MPGTDLFPADAMARAAAKVLRGDHRSLQYGLPRPALKCQVVELMRLRGLEAEEGQVFLTTGSQQAMDLLTRLLLDPGGQGVLQETVYDGIQMVLRPLAPELLTVPSCPERGIDLDALEALLEGGARPAFLYVIAEGHNPLGVSLDLERRARLVELNLRFRLPILEDDAYGLLRYDGSGPPPLRALDDRWVLHLGSFSKILASAMRVGWILIPKGLGPQLSALKHSADLDTATFAQRTLAAYLEAGHLPAHLARILLAYRERRDAMLDALSREMPPGVCWQPPEEGIFVWLRLPGATTPPPSCAAPSAPRGSGPARPGPAFGPRLGPDSRGEVGGPDRLEGAGQPDVREPDPTESTGWGGSGRSPPGACSGGVDWPGLPLR